MGSIMDLFFRIGVDSSELDRGLADASRKASSFGSAFKSGVGTVLGVGAKAVGVATAAVGAFAGASVKAGSDFDKSMSQVAATMGVTKDDIGELTEFAQEMGRTTAFSASEAADAMNILAMAGYSAEDSMATLPSVLNMAAAGGLSIADAADYATGIMAGFSRETLDATTIADKLAVVASSAKGDVRSFGEGLNTVAGMANTTGQSMNDMTVALGILGNNNVAAAEAGNALSRTLKNLYQPTDSAAKAMKKLGVSSYDAEGNARPLQDVLIDLNSSMEGWSDEAKNQYLSQIFDAATLKTVPALLNNATTEWDELDKKLQNSRDAAENMAKVQLDNLPGDITMFKSALEGAQIAISDGLTPTLREFVQFGTKGLGTLTDAFQDGGLSGAMSALGGILSDGIALIMDKLPDFIDAGMSLLGALGQGIIDNLPQLIDASAQIVVQLANGLVQALPSIVDAAFVILTTLTETLLEQAPVLAEAGLNALTSLTEGMDPLVVIEKIGEILGSLVDHIIEWIPTLLDQGIAMVDEMSAGLAENGPAAIEAIGSILGDLITKIIDNLPEFLAKGIELIAHIAQGIADNLPEILSAMAGVLADLIAKIAESLPDFLAKGVELLGEVGAGILDAVPDLLGKIPGIFSDVVDKFASQDWASIGKNIIEGVKSGISSAAAKIADAAKEAARKALDAAKSFLGIKSPSRVFKEQIGKNISLGLASGIENYANEVEDAAEALAESATDPFEAFDEVSKYVIPDMPETAVLGASGGTQGISESVLNEKLGRIIDLLQNIDLSGAGVYIDGRTLVGELVPAMDLAMGREASYKGRGVI